MLDVLEKGVGDKRLYNIIVLLPGHFRKMGEGGKYQP